MMRLLVVLCLAFVLPPPFLSAAENNGKKDPRFKLTLRSKSTVPGGSVSSGIQWGDLLASDERCGEGKGEMNTEALPSEEGTLLLRKKTIPYLRYIKKKGRITMQLSHKSTSNDSNSTRLSRNSGPDRLTSRQPYTFTVAIDPFAALRLLGIFGVAARHFITAFIGTLKLLGPLIFARRFLFQVGELISDYLMGRYLRTTAARIDRRYWRAYQGPAACRSLGRCCAHTVALILLGRFMEWMVGLRYPPCVIPPKADGFISCHWWCGLLWLVAVIGSGNLIAALVATRGPLKIKIAKSSLSKPTKRRRFFSKPLTYLKWMRDPDRWLVDIATNRRDNAKFWKPFTPEPLLFPSTWPPFSIVRNFAVAKAMASSSDIAAHDSMHVIMRQFLIQQAILDEWHRVLMDERRVGLGICAIAVGFTASCFLFVSVAYANAIAAVLMVPSLLATFSSAWMNLFVFWDRRREKATRQNLVVIKRRKRLGWTSYAIKW